LFLYGINLFIIAKLAKTMKQEINFRILETKEACKSIHALEQEKENHISIKELLILEEIYG
tara:strand:- start:61 stop:243 length:183 start_codon:yes stop_codon:yes gene_type:complete